MAPRRLTQDELDELLEYTTGQWADGIGENFAGEYEEETGLQLDLGGLYSGDEEVFLIQDDCGSIL
jgi:hypothetical protein